MKHEIKDYADFRVSEDGEILIIIDEELFDPSKELVIYYRAGVITSVVGRKRLEIDINHKDLKDEIEKCKKIHMIEQTDSGFFQIIPNIKLIRK